MEPPNPLIMASAISVAVPSLSMDCARLSTSDGAVLISANHFAIWFFPKIALEAAICSDSDRLANASCNSFWIVAVSFMDPSELVTLMPSLSIHSAPSFAGFTSRAIPVFNALAASPASIPAFAMMPMYSAASSTEYPAALNTGAAMLMESAKLSTSSAELLQALANTSA